MNNYYYNKYFDLGQQKINFNLYQIGLPEDDAVYTLKRILKELNFNKLFSRYSNKGRKGYNPIMIYALIVYKYARHKECRYHSRFMPKRYMFYVAVQGESLKEMSFMIL